MERVVVVGGGISGVACARELTEAGVSVQVRDRGRRIGGRMAVRTLGGRPVDVGAAYFTVSDERFHAVVDDWVARGLARTWTDTFQVIGSGGSSSTTGPMRYAAPGGLRSLVEDLASVLDVVHPIDVQDVVGSSDGPVVDGEPTLATVLAMPTPQARDLLDEALLAELPTTPDAWESTLALVAVFAERTWPALDAAFVTDSEVLSFVADDGRRRGDDAPVLVAHSTSQFADAHLDDPARGGDALVTELQRVLGVRAAPLEVTVLRWSLARPGVPLDEPFVLSPSMLGLCGDGWHGKSRVEAAFLSGHALGRALVEELAG